MSPIDNPLPNLSDERIDLLVDGELPERERRELLLALDQVSGGWRRCALAFLEAQAWKQEIEMQTIRRESTPQPQPPRTTRPSRLRIWGTLLPVAASFLVALGLGLFLRDVWRETSATDRGPNQIAAIPTGPEQKPVEKDQQHPSTGPAATPESWKLVKLPVRTGAGRIGWIQIPATERKHVDRAWLDGLGVPSLPAELLQALHQSGHEVRRHRGWLRVPMDDARELVLPVDEFEFQYVGNPDYQ